MISAQLAFYRRNRKAICEKLRRKNIHWHYAKTEEERHNRLLITYKKYYNNNKEYFAEKAHKRHRNLGFNKLIENDWKEPIDWHHVNDNDVVPIPRVLHKMCYTGDTETHRELCNKLIDILFGGIEK